jgi:Ser/Thr protein kinase RdoA (MazF antagonist)
MMFIMENESIKEISRHFKVDGEFIEARPHGSGHINDTYLGLYQTNHGPKRFVHQRINHNVFKQPEKLMENIERVTSFVRQRIIEAGGDPDRETLTLVPSQDGKSFYKTAEGEYWRTYVFINGARTYEIVEDLRHVYSAAKAFGNFQKLLDSLPGERLHETIPSFHHTRRRFEAFKEAVEKDAANRAKNIRSEIDFYLQRQAIACLVVDGLENGLLPERITHNDTKLNNVLIDNLTGEGVCVIDLDTIMPGSALYDFGDLVRMGTATAAEDEVDLSKVGMDLHMFDCLARGYLDATRDFLTAQECALLVCAGQLITFEQGIRFLTDYLNGDIYYKVHHPEHNLERTRTQHKMLQEMEAKADEMEAIIRRYC